MSNNLIEFGRRTKDPEPPSYDPLPPASFTFTYKLPDNTIGYHSGVGVIKMNGPFLVFTDVDKEHTTLQDAQFMIMFEHLNNIKRTDAPQEAS